MKKIYCKNKNGYKDCGPSCLLSIMKYYGFEASHEEVTMNLKTTREGTNAFNIINGSRLYGFDGYASHYSCDDIINNKVTFPIICHCKKKIIIYIL
ncbi:MAG: cysteine peptidase family C39 domain-containing protein [Clostridium sp.]|nr:MAG: cysteine peptidase family C39 domain-containing protein [Clostridium sp.]